MRHRPPTVTGPRAFWDPSTIALLLEELPASWSAPVCRGCSKRLRKRLKALLRQQPGKEGARAKKARRHRCFEAKPVIGSPATHVQRTTAHVNGQQTEAPQQDTVASPPRMSSSSGLRRAGAPAWPASSAGRSTGQKWEMSTSAHHTSSLRWTRFPSPSQVRLRSASSPPNCRPIKPNHLSCFSIALREMVPMCLESCKGWVVTADLVCGCT